MPDLATALPRGAEAPRPLVATIVVNWNGWRDTLECLESLRRIEGPRFFVILVDNGSSDDSLGKVREWCAGRRDADGRFDVPPLRPRFQAVEPGPALPPAVAAAARGEGGVPLVLVRLEANRGFAGGNNVALALARSLPDVGWMWLLNNDTVADPRALEELLAAARGRGRAGMLGSAIHDYERPEEIQSLGSMKILWPRPGALFGSSPRGAVREVGWVSGASLLVRREALEDTGPIDEDYFLFGEEKDWCVRARRRGWVVYAVPASRVRHKWGVSSRSSRTRRRFLGRSVTRIAWSGYGVPGYYESRNGVLFARKLFPRWLPAWTAVRTLHLVGQTILYDDRKLSRIGVILRGTWDGLRGRAGMTLDPAASLSAPAPARAPRSLGRAAV